MERLIERELQSLRRKTGRFEPRKTASDQSISTDSFCCPKAETGSGKTVAYLLPMLVHAIAQPWEPSVLLGLVEVSNQTEALERTRHAWNVYILYMQPANACESESFRPELQKDDGPIGSETIA